MTDGGTPVDGDRGQGDPALAISTRGLRKVYRRASGKRLVAVAGLDLDVPAGGVHGFLGPNGSGKTTTIRLLLGLAGATAGTMQIFGTPVPRRLPEIIGRVGSVVEQPKFFGTMSGRQNLRYLADVVGVDRRAVETVLETVGLEDRAGDRVRGYSLGMKQRLAIAATLLKDPDLLIFDEPTNGLDPAGIREIRDTMRGLADRGKTVLVSSHILAEVEQVADTVSIVTRGSLVASGAVSDLIGQRASAGARVGVSDPAAAETILVARGWTVRHDKGALVVAGAPDPAAITEALAQHALYVNELTPLRVDLEQVFLELTGGAA